METPIYLQFLDQLSYSIPQSFHHKQPANGWLLSHAPAFLRPFGLRTGCRSRPGALGHIRLVAVILAVILKSHSNVRSRSLGQSLPPRVLCGGRLQPRVGPTSTSVQVIKNEEPYFFTIYSRGGVSISITCSGPKRIISPSQSRRFSAIPGLLSRIPK